MDKRELAASILGCGPGDLLGFADLESQALVVVVGPTGQKYRFTYVQIEDERTRLAALRRDRKAELPRAAADSPPRAGAVPPAGLQGQAKRVRRKPTK